MVRTLGLFYLGGVIVPAAVTLLLQHVAPSPVAGSSLHYAGAFLVGSAAQDSWEPMRQAFSYLAAPHTQPLYTALFFERGVNFIYPPTSLLLLDLMRPFSGGRLPSDALLNGFCWLGVIATAMLAARVFLASVAEHAARPASRTERRLVGGLALAYTLAFFPIVKGFTLGQVQTLSTLLFAAAAASYIEGHRGAAGALSGVMCAIKPQMTPLLLWAVLRGQRRFTAGWLAAVLPIAMLSVWRFGWTHHWNYLELISFVARHSWSHYPNQSVNGLLNRFLFNGTNVAWDPQYAPFQPVVFAGTLTAAALLVGAAVFWRLRDRGAGSAVDFFAAALSFTMASPLAWEHHYGIMLVMFAYALPATLALCAGRTRALVLLSVSFVLSSHLYPAAALTADSRMNVLQSYLLAGALLLLVHLYRLRRQPVRTIASRGYADDCSTPRTWRSFAWTR